MKRLEKLGRNHVTSRRKLLISLLGAVVIGTVATRRASAEARHIKVWKDPNCGCCSKWVEHLRSNGFTAEIIETDDIIPIKKRHGIFRELASCHTALIGGYVIEGHVPATAIKKLLSEHPDADGLAVPGMPVGSPGMEGSTPEPYDVILFKDGKHQSFGRYLGSEPQ